VIMPLSNPNSKSEAHPADLITWTKGQALVATGSPFDPVSWQGRTIHVGQANNIYIFPGVGLGALVADATRVTDGMFVVAAAALAQEVPENDLAAGSLFPSLHDLRRITSHVAQAVVRQAREEGVGRAIEESEIPAAVAEAMWTPSYRDYIPAEHS